ncbi:MAG TPA: ABC transporter permease [Terriglobales bacterium]|nr:ABC transporter permease [Terriglobales bacterium]
MFVQELRQAARSLGKSKGFTTVAVLTLALGIGANTALFSVVYAVLLHALPFQNASRVYRVDRVYENAEFAGGAPPTIPWQSAADIQDIETQAHSFAAMAATRFEGVLTLNAPGAAPRAVLAVRATPNLFSVLGFAPLFGRGFTAAEAAHQAPVVVLSNRFWRSEFNADPAVVGRELRLNGETYRVIGVLPPHLLIFGAPVGALLPLSMAALPPQMRDRGVHSMFLYGLLRPGVSPSAAEAEMRLIGERLQRAYPKTDAHQGMTLVGLRATIARDVRPALLLLLAAVGLVLLIACANLSGMMLVRATERQRELAIRLALGASHADLLRPLLAETIWLAGGGCCAGLVVAWLALPSLLALAPSALPAVGAIRLDPAVLGFAIALSVAAALFCALVPAAQMRRRRLAGLLAERASTGRREAAFARRAITVAEAALAVVLVFAAGVLLKNFAQLYAEAPGFRTRGLLTFAVTLDQARGSLAQQNALIASLRRALGGVPGVAAVGASTNLPLERGSDWLFTIAGQPAATSITAAPDALVRFVSPGYLQAAGFRLAAGRYFTEADDTAAAPVVIVNQALARRYFAGQKPLTEHIELGSVIAPGLQDVGERSVVGVLADAHTVSLDLPDQPTLYVPFAQVPPRLAAFIYGGFSVAVATRGDADLLRKAAIAAVHQVAPALPISSISTGEQLIAADVAPQRFDLALIALFAALGLFLAALGLYGVMAYSVAERRAEIGVRIAFGAQRADVLRLVVGGGMKLAAFGVALGLAASLLLRQWLAPFVHGAIGADPATIVFVAIVFLAVAFAATLVPSLRASHLAPAEILRSQ